LLFENTIRFRDTNSKQPSNVDKSHAATSSASATSSSSLSSATLSSSSLASHHDHHRVHHAPPMTITAKK
jgi:hypothetical protein